MIRGRGFSIALTVVAFSLFARDEKARGSEPDVAEAQAGVPEHLTELLGTFSRRPPSRLLSEVVEEDEDSLTTLYHAAPDLAHRRALTWALAYVGDEETVEVLKSAVVKNYKGQWLNQSEEDVLFDTVLAMGFLAAEHDSAYEFVRRGVDRASSKTGKTWSSKRGEYAIDLLVSFSVQAIGVSGRADVPDVLSSLKLRSAAYLHRFAGDVVQAAFYYSMQQERGREFLKQNLVTGHKHHSLFDEWIETPVGKEWYDWANECMRGPRPAQAENAD